MVGRSAGSVASIRSSSGVSRSAFCGGSTSPLDTRNSRAIVLSAVPNGGLPSMAAYSVAPSEKTSAA